MILGISPSHLFRGRIWDKNHILQTSKKVMKARNESEKEQALNMTMEKIQLLREQVIHVLKEQDQIQYEGKSKIYCVSSDNYVLLLNGENTS